MQIASNNRESDKHQNSIPSFIPWKIINFRPWDNPRTLASKLLLS